MNKIDEKYEALLTPWKIGNVEIKNRIVMCPMGGTSLFGWFAVSPSLKVAVKARRIRYWIRMSERVPENLYWLKDLRLREAAQHLKELQRYIRSAKTSPSPPEITGTVPLKA